MQNFAQPYFFLCSANTVFVQPQSLIFSYLNVDHLQNNITSRYLSFVNNVNFKFWLQLWSKLIAAMHAVSIGIMDSNYLTSIERSSN